MGETVTLVSDMRFNWALTPQDYKYDMVDIAAQLLPANGTVTVTKHNGATPAALNTRHAGSTMSTWDGPTRTGLEMRSPSCATMVATPPLRIATTKSPVALLRVMSRPE